MQITQNDLITTANIFLVIAGIITLMGTLIVYLNKKTKKGYGSK